MTNDHEMWSPIHDWPTYEVSSLGRVRRVAGGRWNVAGKVLTARPNSKGYLRVQLRFNGASRMAAVHSLVLEAFQGPRPCRHLQAAHLDGNKLNNSPCNLSWVTPKENCAHRALHGTHTYGQRNSQSKLTDARVAEARRRYRDGETGTSIAKDFGVSMSCVLHAINGKTWRHVT